MTLWLREERICQHLELVFNSFRTGSLSAVAVNGLSVAPFTAPDKPQCVGDNRGDNPALEGSLFWGTHTSKLWRVGREDWGDGGWGCGVALLPGCCILGEGDLGGARDIWTLTKGIGQGSAVHGG